MSGIDSEPDVEALGAALWDTARDHEQAATRITDVDTAERTRAAVRRLAAQDGIRIRTARMGQVVVVARLDAAIWTDDTATMRRKLTPPE